MIIDLKDIESVPRRFEFVLGTDWWPDKDETGQALSLASPLDVRITLYRAGSKVVLEGRIAGKVLLHCDRCLEPCPYDVTSDFRLFLAPPPASTGPSEVELLHEDLHTDFIAGEEVDLKEVVREQVYFSLPMKVLCSDQCAGLCPKCGANLNRGKCGCLSERGHPAFSKLKILKLREK